MFFQKNLDIIECYEELLKTYKKHNLNFHIARAYLNLSIVYRDRANINIAISMASEALHLSSKHGFTTLEAAANKELGVLHMNIRNVAKAFNLSTLALNNYKEDHDKKGAAFCIGNMELIRQSKVIIMRGIAQSSLGYLHFAGLLVGRLK